ncbi:MAG: DUF2442 domain-containing protein [Actinomycetota bacterium]|jgi:Protein of unknown function (DUF2442)|nr:DUF2442 domain-containing protein [Actinomycetota bacterium]
MKQQTTRVRITSAKPLDGYVLRVDFSDGTHRDVDLEQELWGPVFEPLRDLEFFRRVAVDPELGTVVWPNGADMDPDVLRGERTAANANPTMSTPSGRPNGGSAGD